MKLSITNEYTIPGSSDPVKAYEDRCLRDPSWQATLQDKIGSDAKVLKNEINGDKLHLEVLVQPRSETIPALLKTVMGEDALDFVETTDYSFKTHRGTFSTRMENPAFQSFSTKGSFSLRSDSPERVKWTSKTDVKCKMWMVGRKVERTIVNEVKARNPEIRGYIQEHLNSIDEG